jgi:hypothetical protein
MFVNWQVCRPVTYSLKDRGEGGRRREKEGEGGGELPIFCFLPSIISSYRKRFKK